MKKSVIVQKKGATDVKRNSSSDVIGSAVSSLSSMAVKPVQDIIEREIDKYSAQARAKLAKERGISQSKVPDLDVAEYLLGMPTANLTRPVQDISKTLRNSLLVMTVAICTTIYLVHRKYGSR